MWSQCGTDHHNFYLESFITQLRLTYGLLDVLWQKWSCENLFLKVRLNFSNWICTLEQLAPQMNKAGQILNPLKIICMSLVKSIPLINSDKWSLKVNLAIKEFNSLNPYLLQIQNKELLLEKLLIIHGSKKTSVLAKICLNTNQ